MSCPFRRYAALRASRELATATAAAAAISGCDLAAFALSGLLAAEPDFASAETLDRQP